MITVIYCLANADTDGATMTVVTVPLTLHVPMIAPTMMTSAFDHHHFLSSWMVHVRMAVSTSLYYYGLGLR